MIKKIEKAIKFILGRVIVTNDLDTAISLTRKFKNQFKIVTLKGEVINPGGSITGGSILKSQNILKRKEDIKLEDIKCNKLAEELKELEKYKDGLTKEIEKTREKLDDIINNINIKASILNDLIKTKSFLEMEIEKLNTIIKQSKLEEKQVRDVINSYDEEINKYKDNISQLYQKKSLSR